MSPRKKLFVLSSIALYFLIASQLDGPIIAPSCSTIRLHIHSYPSSVAIMTFQLIVMCLLFVISHPKDLIQFHFLNFFLPHCHPEWHETITLSALPWSNLVVTPPPITNTVFWLLVVCHLIIWWLFLATERVTSKICLKFRHPKFGIFLVII